MSKAERAFLIGLGALALLALAVIFAGPWLASLDSTGDRDLVPGETETLSARVIEILEEGTVDLGTSTQPYQRLRLYVTGGSLAGEEVVVEEGTINVISQDRLFDVGDRVYLERVVGFEGDRYYISDPDRTTPLLLSGLLFVGLVVLIGRGRGLRSLLGTLVSIVVIFGGVLPLMKEGWDPVLACITGSVVLLAATAFLTYGWNPKSQAAMIGMVLSLGLTVALSWLFVRWTRLTGLGPEEGAFVVMEMGSDFDLRGLVLGGIVVGSLGVLDDVCVGQASAVFELANVNRSLGWMDLFRSSLNIGRDHIAAMVNTLMLAYVGTSLPLMLAFTFYDEPLMRRINREPIAEEIVRTLVGSIGLVLAVPITGLVASLMARRAVEEQT